MILAHELQIPDSAEFESGIPFMEFAFPGTSSKTSRALNSGEPKALLSLLPAGDMGLDIRAGYTGRSVLGHRLPARCITLNPKLVHGRDTIFFGPGNKETDDSVSGCSWVNGDSRAGSYDAVLTATGHGEQNAVFTEYPKDLARGIGIRLGDADGILVQDDRWAPCVTVADCMPIWIWDRDQGWFGVLHSGWKGTGILSDTIKRLCFQGSRSESIAVILGPSIGKCCYTVPEERAVAFESLFGRDSVCREHGVYTLDLRVANVNLAKKSGIQDILSVANCTSCNPALGSFRREGPARFTRMAALAWIPDHEDN